MAIVQPRDIKDRVATGDDKYTLTDLGDGRSQLVPTPDTVLEAGTDLNKQLFQLMEDRICQLMNGQLTGMELITYIDNRTNWRFTQSITFSGTTTFSQPSTMYTRTVNVKAPYTENNAGYKVTRMGNTVTVTGGCEVLSHGILNGQRLTNTSERIPYGYRPRAGDYAVVHVRAHYQNDRSGHIWTPGLSTGQERPEMYGVLPANNSPAWFSFSGSWITTDPWV